MAGVSLPAGFQIVEEPEAPALPEGFVVVPEAETPPAAAAVAPTGPEDKSTWQGDVEAGYLGLRNALTGAGVAKNAAVAQGHQAIGNVPGAAANRLGQEIEALEAQIAASPSAAEQAMLGQTLADMQTEMQGFGEIATSPEFADEMARRETRAGELRAQLPGQIATIISRQAQISEIPMNPSAKATGDPEGDGFWERTQNAIGSFLEDPGGVTRTFGLRAGGTSLPSILTGILGTAVAGPGGGATGAGIAGGITELGATMADEVGPLLTDAGVDQKDPEAIAEFIKANPDEFDAALRKGLTRAGIIGALDAVSGGIIGKIAQSTVNKGAGKRVAGALGGGSAEALTEGVSEATALKVTEGEINPGEVLAEIIGGAGIGIPGTAIQTTQALAGPRKVEAPSEPQVPEGFEILPETSTSEVPQVAQPPVPGERAAPESPQAAPEQAVSPPETAPAPVEAGSTLAAPAAPAEPAPGAAPTVPATPAAPPASAIPGEAPNTGENPAAPAVQTGAPAEPEAQTEPPALPEPDGLDDQRGPMAEIERLVGEASRLGRDPARPGDYSANLADVAPQIQAEIEKLAPEDREGAYISALETKLNSLPQTDTTPAAPAPDSEVVSQTAQTAPAAPAAPAAQTAPAAPAAPEVDDLGNPVPQDGGKLAVPSTAEVRETQKTEAQRKKADDEAASQARYQAAQDEMGELSREIESRDTDPKQGTAKYSSKATQAQFEQDMAEIESFAASLREKHGLTNDEMPTVEYRLRRETGDTLYTLKTGNVMSGARDTGVSHIESFRKRMTKGRSGMSPGGAPTAANPSVGPNQRFREQPAGELQDAAPTKPRDGDEITPEGSSTTERASVNEQTFIDAGLDPDEAQLMPAGKRVRALSQAVSDKFGFEVGRAPNNQRADGQDATDQLLDAHRNLQFMASVLGLPAKALSLGGRLKLSLERRTSKYLGVYRHDTHEIGLPGRSNSFAHEWMHALDHFLRDETNPQVVGELLSQGTRGTGIDPASDLNGAFVNLIHRLFFDEANLAQHAMALEVTAAKTDKNGDPTKGAIAAQKQLDRLLTGATRIKIKPSNLREGSSKFTNGKYLSSVHELTARAFEAYVAYQVERAGGKNEFITKGDRAYLNEANDYMNLAYPKASERMAIFAAFDDLFTQIVRDQLLGTGPAASVPADGVVYNARAVDLAAAEIRDPSVARAVREEGRKLLNILKTDHSRSRKQRIRDSVSEIAVNAGLNPNRSVGANFKLLGQRTARTLHHLVGSTRGVAKALVKAQPANAQHALEFLLSGVMTDPGTGKNVAATFEEQRDTETNKVAARIMNLLKVEKFGSKLSTKDNDIVRDLLLGKPKSTVKGATERHVRVAAGIRRMQNDTRREGNAAGLDIGYIENTGYFQRVLQNSKVHQAAEQFVADATKVYEIVYDALVADISAEDMVRLATSVSNRAAPQTSAGTNGPFASEIKALRKAIKDNDLLGQQRQIDDLKPLLREPYSATAAEDWKGRVLVGDSMSFDSLGPSADFLKHRTLPPEADDLLADWYETDVLTSALSYAGSVTSRAAHVRHYGQTSGNKKLNQVLKRADVAAGIRSDPAKYDVNTPEGRTNIIQDLTDTRKDNRMAMAIWEAQEQGGIGEDIVAIKGIVEQITGRSQRDNPTMAAANAVSTSMYVLTYIALLPRATLTAITEPITYALRTGDVPGTFRVMGKYLSEAVRAMPSVQERAELARQIGIVSTKLHDVVMLNRLSGDFGNAVGSNVIMANFFRANMLAQVTNAQRRAMMDGGFFWMRDLAKQYANPRTDTARKNIIKAEFSELGIGPDAIDDVVKYMKDRTELWALDDLDTFAGDQTARAVSRFVDQTIQNPRRADKPLLAATPAGRVIFALTSFLYTFYRNVHLATVNRTKRDYNITREAGAGKAEAAVAAGLPALQSLGIGFGMMWAGQMAVSAAREAIFNQDQWEEREEADELFAWLGTRAASRTGVGGPMDVLINAVFGLRYERDLANLLVGPGISSRLSQIQRMMAAGGVGGRNSPNTNTAEWGGAKAGYQFAVVPAMSLFLSALPVGGPVTAAARYAALLGGTSNSAAEAFADTVAGPKPPRRGSSGTSVYGD